MPQEDVGQVEEGIQVCPGPTVVQGVDVSHYDGAIDWTKTKAAGIGFAIMKATETTTYFDPTFDTNWAASKKAGVIRGAYHFFRANVDPIAQAQWYLSKVTLEPGDLPPTLDLETTDGETGATIAANAIKWLDYVAAKTGMKPLLYSSPSFISGTLGSPAGFQNHATLWVANWGVSCPNVPSPFTKWAVWQYSSTGTVNGIPSTAVDLDEFDGTLSELKAITMQPPAAGDAGTTDSGAGSDAGAGTTDSGAGKDAGAGSDAGAGTTDSGAGSDAGTAGGDAATVDAAGDASALPVLSSTTSSGGCTASGSGAAGSSGALATLALLGAFAVRRRRRAA